MWWKLSSKAKPEYDRLMCAKGISSWHSLEGIQSREKLTLDERSNISYVQLCTVISLCDLEKTFYIIGKCFSNTVLEWGAALEIFLSVFDTDNSKGGKKPQKQKSKQTRIIAKN